MDPIPGEGLSPQGSQSRPVSTAASEGFSAFAGQIESATKNCGNVQNNNLQKKEILQRRWDGLVIHSTSLHPTFVFVPKEKDSFVTQQCVANNNYGAEQWLDGTRGVVPLKKSISRVAFNQLKNIWRSSSLTTNIKIRRPQHHREAGPALWTRYLGKDCHHREANPDQCRQLPQKDSPHSMAR
ncbi:hypothetical protein ACOMHN_039738 [Nucella lapillus]